MKSYNVIIIVLGALLSACTAQVQQSFDSLEKVWSVDSQEEWQQHRADQSNLKFVDGFAEPTAKESTFKSTIKSFRKKRLAKSITFKQSPIWQNWSATPNVKPVNLKDAPVMLCLGPQNYWLFGRYGKVRKFTPKAAKLKGFDVPLQTTPFKNQYNAPGGLKPTTLGYHAWQSRDMVNWVHHGPITESLSRWMTTAEYVDGKFYFYYDYPNDQDPHLYIDSDLTDGLPGINKGLVFKDPSHGSDCVFIRDEKGRFHVIYEDWSPINARERSWDSPLAGHAVSDDGIKDFKILPPAIDNRTKPTGEIGRYKHPHWASHPDWRSNWGEYNIHSPEQEAYGDWASINIGGQYYLFGDYDPVGGHEMSVGWFTSSSLDKKFTWCDKIGTGHPDPDIGFAEGQFYLITQLKTDFVSPGPWVEKVEGRVGVDTNNDGQIDHWSAWQEVKESYSYKPGFAKHIQKTAAEIDLEHLPAGYGFQFEFKMTDTTENKSRPIMDKVSIQFKN
jgi:hypothetical protein